jgi:restriction system protein
MAHRRGLLAEFQHQQRLAQTRANQAARAQAAARAQVQRAQAAQARATAAAIRTSEAERKRAEKEAQAAYVESRQAEVQELNDELAYQYEEIDGLLQATLEVDDFVDLEALKKQVSHPPFPWPELQAPRPQPEPIHVSEPPIFTEPEVPKGLFGKKKKHAEVRQQAWNEYQEALQQWEAFKASVPGRQEQLANQHAALERTRLDMLEAATAQYDAECRLREQEVVEHNSAIDALIAGLGYGVVDAVQEYVGIVLANSIYPPSFEVVHEAEFEPETAELKLTVIVPAPDALSTVKSYRYVKASDEIAETALSRTDANNRYASALHQVTLRSMHEIFEADRRGIIQAMSLQVGPRTKDPATGRDTFLPLVAVTAPRDLFMSFDLAGVIPSATLQHLGAAVSKNPSTLTTVDTSGIRRS